MIGSLQLMEVVLLSCSLNDMNGGLKTTCVHNPIISMFFFPWIWNKRVKGFKQVMLVSWQRTLSSPLQWLDSDSNENLPFAREGLLNYTAWMSRTQTCSD